MWYQNKRMMNGSPRVCCFRWLVSGALTEKIDISNEKRQAELFQGYLFVE